MPEATLVSSELKLAGRLDARFFALLTAIDHTGSINRAARTAGYSYKGAWLLLEAAATLAKTPLVQSSTGGKHGGGSRLTGAARDLLSAWAALQQANKIFLFEQDRWLNEQPAIAGLLRRMSMKTTARNQFSGRISAIEAGPVSTEVTLTIAGGQEIVASLTTAASQRLKLALGQEGIALIKSSAVVLVTDFAGYVLSARNQFAGVVSRIDKGAVSALVVLTLPGGSTITASVTNDAVSALALAVGQPATAVFKAYAVMLAVAV